MITPLMETRIVVNPVFFKCLKDYAAVDGVTFMFGNPKKIENKMTIKKLRENKDFVEIGEKLPDLSVPEVRETLTLPKRRGRPPKDEAML